jgi:hypothetical protein
MRRVLLNLGAPTPPLRNSQLTTHHSPLSTRPRRPRWSSRVFARCLYPSEKDATSVAAVHGGANATNRHDFATHDSARLGAAPTGDCSQHPGPRRSAAAEPFRVFRSFRGAHLSIVRGQFAKRSQFPTMQCGSSRVDEPQRMANLQPSTVQGSKPLGSFPVASKTRFCETNPNGHPRCVAGSPGHIPAAEKHKRLKDNILFRGIHLAPSRFAWSSQPSLQETLFAKRTQISAPC